MRIRKKYKNRDESQIQIDLSKAAVKIKATESLQDANYSDNKYEEKVPMFKERRSSGRSR